MMLEIRNLKKTFGKFYALDGLDMDIGDGALYGFVGPNGAGKTTTIKIMTGLLEADEGEPTRVNEAENSGVKWVPFAEVAEHSQEPVLVDIFNKMLNRLREGLKV